MYPPSSRSQAGGKAAGVEWAAKGSPVLSPGGPHHRAGEEARGSTWHLLKTLPRPSVLPPTPSVASMERGERGEGWQRGREWTPGSCNSASFGEEGGSQVPVLRLESDMENLPRASQELVGRL